MKDVAKQARTRTPKHSQMGLWEGPGRIFSSSRFSTALWIPCGIVFGAFWGALGAMSASVGTKNTIRNQYQFEVFCRTQFCFSFWSTLGSLGCAFGNLLYIFSGMGAKVKTVLAPTRELDFQGLGGSGSVLFEGLVRDVLRNLF